MIELPILAFNIDGCRDSISLNINEIFGYPSKITYGGGYAAKGMLKICVGSYKVYAEHNFTTGELYNFFCDLQNCYNKIQGKAILTNIDKELSLNILFNKLGQVKVYGEFQELLDVDNKLSFEMDTDQSAILHTLNSLKKVYYTFGDEMGNFNKK